MLRFDAFALDPDRHVLSREGRDLPLSPRLVDILAHLASHAGALVTREALLERFWPDVRVTGNTLTRAIADIRKALGDNAASPRFIQTVARRGYRFVGAGEGWATLGHVQAAAGELEAARAAARRAAALEPGSWRHQFSLSVASWGEERLRACDRTLALLPDFAPARFAMAMVLTARQAFAPALMAASAGATAQSRQPRHESWPFPAIGLHWLRGLLLLRERQVGLAIESFAREMDELPAAQLAGEFRVTAQVAAGFAHLAANDASGAIDAFRIALESLPRNGRALVGLYSALRLTTLAREARLLLPRIEETIAELAAGQRQVEAAAVRAAAEVSRGEMEAACVTLEHLLESAPPGQAGWEIPIDPALAPLRAHPSYPRIVALLAARAA